MNTFKTHGKKIESLKKMGSFSTEIEDIKEKQILEMKYIISKV